MQSIQVAVVDRHDLSRNGIQMLIARAEVLLTNAGAFEDLQSCLLFLKDSHVDVLLLDDDLPRSLDIGQLIKRLLSQFPHMVIIVLSRRLIATYIKKLLDYGATGFIYKEDRLQETLTTAIETVWNGDIYLSPKASALPYMGKTSAPTIGSLNPHDVAVLKRLADGHTVKEIADHFDVSTRTVYRIRRKLRMVLDVRTNEQIVDVARVKGLLNEMSDAYSGLE